MLNINFVPDDYIRSNESRRANLMYLALFVVVMAVLAGVFVTIRIRHHALNAKERLVNAKLARAQEAVEQFEELQTKRTAMMTTALTTAELLESVPRSILLASLTNNLPRGVSFVRLKLVQKQPKQVAARSPKAKTKPIGKYEAAQTQKAGTTEPRISREKLLETHIDIGGIAPSDIQVAAYIERLSSSGLFDNVALVESKEHKIKERTFRHFRLTTMLKKGVHLVAEDVAIIRAERKKAAFRH